MVYFITGQEDGGMGDGWPGRRVAGGWRDAGGWGMGGRAGGWRGGGWVAGRMQGNMVNKLKGWCMADLMQWCYEEEMPKTAELIQATRFDGEKLVRLTIKDLSMFDDRFEVGEPLFSTQMSLMLKLEKQPLLKRLRCNQPGLLFFVLSAALPIFCFLL